MKILLVETTQYFPASPLFGEAMAELQAEGRCTYVFFDECPFLQPLSTSIVHKIAYRLLIRRPLTYWRYNRELLAKALEYGPDVVFIIKGAYIAPRTLEVIKRETGALLINYAADDPFNPATPNRSLVTCIPHYDLYVCTKKAIMEDVRRAGAKQVMYVPFGYKPSVHFPEMPISQEEKHRFESDVVFLGGMDQDRLPLFESLHQALPDVRLHLYGGYWEKSQALGSLHKGLAFGRDYRLALGGCKIAVNVVRRSNRDDHVMRTFEIPACRAFMLAERTPEHLEMFREGTEMACFSTAQELIQQVRYFLTHHSERQSIADGGHKKVLNGKFSYKDRLQEILDYARSLLAT